jgi:hypothetical protein
MSSRPEWLDDWLSGDKILDERPDVVGVRLRRYVKELEADLQEYKEGNAHLHGFNNRLSKQIHAELIPAQKRVEELERVVSEMRELDSWIYEKVTGEKE